MGSCWFAVALTAMPIGFRPQQWFYMQLSQEGSRRLHLGLRWLSGTRVSVQVTADSLYFSSVPNASEVQATRVGDFRDTCTHPRG